VIGQRKVEHEIRLKDGEVSLLGGMLEQDDSQSLTGIPGAFTNSNPEISIFSKEYRGDGQRDRILP